MPMAEDQFCMQVSASLATANKSVTDEARDTKTHLQFSDQQSALIHNSFLLMWYFVTFESLAPMDSVITSCL